MLPSHMQHPFVDRYRDSHNASPSSLVDEDTMNPPAQVTFARQGLFSFLFTMVML